jgi:integrase/recombinase XerD
LENKTQCRVTQITRYLTEGTKEQNETLAAFDKFNELEAGCSLATRMHYLTSLTDLGKNIQKPFEQMTKENLQEYIGALSQRTFGKDGQKRISQGTIFLHKAHLKRFFTWLEMVKCNAGKPDEEKADIKGVTVPYSVRWMKLEQGANDIEFEDLPTEEEIKTIVEHVEKQRDRAFILVAWETGASPVEILGLRIKDVSFNQHGAIVKFQRYTSRKTEEINQLKTPFRYRNIPIVSSVPDLMNWLSMHPEKTNVESPVWLSRQGGRLSYFMAQSIFKNACKRAGITKHLTLYSLRHGRISEVSKCLSTPELKQFAGHSKSSRITEQRYVHVDEQTMSKKLLKERGVEIKEETKTESALKVKTCPRCKHENSPTFKFCSMCSAPLNDATMFDVQKQATTLEHLEEYPVKTEDETSLQGMFDRFLKENPQAYVRIKQEMYQRIVAEILATKK